MTAAVITGASSGMGREFVRQLDENYAVDELIVIARRKELLEELQQYTKAVVIALPLDLTKPESEQEYASFLKEHQPEIRLLVNASGFGKFEQYLEGDGNVHDQMVDLNCRALQAMTYLSIPYMMSGSRIVEFSSMSAFQPVPYISLYGATKAFVLSYTRALNVELRGTGIHAVALCPYWTKTDFFKVAQGNELVHKFTVMYQSDFIVRECYKCLKKHPKKDVCIPGAQAKMQVGLVKFLPHKLVMNIWLRQQGNRPEALNEKRK